MHSFASVCRWGKIMYSKFKQSPLLSLLYLMEIKGGKIRLHEEVQVYTIPSYSTQPPTPTTRTPFRSSCIHPNQHSNTANTMSGQYGEPDWANPSASPAATSEAGATTSWNAGEDFSGTGANVNIGGSANAGP